MLNLNTNIIWKDVVGYEKQYEVSNQGDVRSKRTLKTLKPYIRHSYFVITLCKKGKIKKHSIHRIVATAFIPNPNNKPQVNHINGIKLTNKADNLEWVTCSENHLHAYTHGLKDPKTACPKIGNNKGTSSTYMYVTHFKNGKEDKYQATIRAKGFTRSKSFSVKKYGKQAEILAAQAANSLIDTYHQFQNRPKNVC